MNIGDVSKACQLPTKTIRYYEDIGLITPNRQSNGYRDFDNKHLRKLAFLQKSRSLGFSVEECRALLALYEDGSRPSSEVKEIAQRRLIDIDRKLTELSLMKNNLRHLVMGCAGDDRPECPILEDLAGERDGGEE